MLEGLLGGGMTMREELYDAIQNERQYTSTSLIWVSQELKRLNDRIDELEKKLKSP